MDSTHKLDRLSQVDLSKQWITSSLDVMNKRGLHAFWLRITNFRGIRQRIDRESIDRRLAPLIRQRCGTFHSDGLSREICLMNLRDKLIAINGKTKQNQFKQSLAEIHAVLNEIKLMNTYGASAVQAAVQELREARREISLHNVDFICRKNYVLYRDQLDKFKQLPKNQAKQHFPDLFSNLVRFAPSLLAEYRDRIRS